MRLFSKLRKKIRSMRLSLRAKLVLSLLSIVAILLVSSVISVMEYSRMSNYVSELIAEHAGTVMGDLLSTEAEMLR